MLVTTSLVAEVLEFDELLKLDELVDPVEPEAALDLAEYDEALPRDVEPDDALVRAVLVKLFVDRQLMVDTTVVEFLALRIERSLASARAIVEALDREALERGRAITRPMAADFLRRLEQTSS